MTSNADTAPTSRQPAVSVCFVCLGNICRSPTAEGVMKHLLVRHGLSHHVHVESAGTAGYHVGDLPDRRSRLAARARGVALESRARQFTRADFDRFDYVLAMDESNREHLTALAPDAAARTKIRLLSAFDPDAAPDAPVPDPYHGGPDGFELVLDLCEAACLGLIEHVRREHPP